MPCSGTDYEYTEAIKCGVYKQITQICVWTIKESRWNWHDRRSWQKVTRAIYLIKYFVLLCKYKLWFIIASVCRIFIISGLFHNYWTFCPTSAYHIHIHLLLCEEENRYNFNTLYRERGNLMQKSVYVAYSSVCQFFFDFQRFFSTPTEERYRQFR